MRKVPLLIAILFGVCLGFSSLARRQFPATPNVAITPGANAPREIGTDTARPIAGPLPAPPTATASPAPEPTMRQHVFRLQLDQGRCTLEKVEEVTGSFGRERAVRWQAGMLCCRLLALDGRVVGERTMPAPDQVCVVLDPNDASGAPAAARLTSDGPAVFQVRFPDISEAVRLEVYRIASEARPAAATPVGQLLASIPIPAK